MNLKQGRELKEFNRLYRELDDIYHEIALKSGLSDSAFLILYTIAEFGNECSQKEIADYYSISRKTINSSIKKLQAEGILTLKTGHKQERYLSLTPAGEALVEKCIVPVVQMENDIFSEMEPNERNELLRLTEKYIECYRRKLYP